MRRAVLLLVMSGLLHFLYLASPRQVIFDEVHFGKFVMAYCCTGERTFDIHPPHGKLLIAAAVRATSYGGAFDFNHIGEPYGPEVPLVAFRFVPALFGTVLPMLVFVLLRQLGTSPNFAFLGGLAVALDNALLVQTRLIALDGTLLVATFGAVSAALAAQASKRASARVGWWIAAGLLAGLAVGVKFTGLVAAATVLLMLARTWWRQPTSAVFRKVLTASVLVVASAALVYIVGWYIHFSLLTQPGSGDVWQIPSGSFWPDLVTVHRQMLSANYHLAGKHPYSSSWWTWPLMLRPVFYWQDGGGLIYFIGNPALWWGVLAALIGSAGAMIGNPRVRRRARAWLGSYGWLLAAGYFISYAPLVNVPRVLFLYHYATPLLFSLLFVVGLLDRLVLPRTGRVRLLTVAIGALALGFALFSPLTFGWPLPAALSQSLFWLPSWR